MNRYKAYSKYKESGVEWLGKIPEHWEKYRIDWTSALIRGNTGFKKDELLSSGKYTALQYGKTYKVDEVNETFSFYVNGKFYKLSQVVHYGDTILISTSETVEDLGHSYFYNRSDLGLIGGEQILLKPNAKFMFDKYLYFYSKVFSNELRRYATGLKVFRFNIDDLKNIFIYLPPIQEQQKIATYLDKATAKIDTLIQKQERLIELLKEKRQALISHKVTKGLNPDAPMRESGIEWLGEIPEHWRTVALKWISHIFAGGTPDKANLSYWENGTVPWINSGAVNQFYIINPSTYITEEAYRNSSAKWIKKDSLVMALAGQGKTKGMVAQLGIDTTCNQSMAAIEVYKIYSSKFLLCWLVANYQNIRNMAGGNLRDGLNLDLLGNIPCPFPLKQEQQQIAQFLDEKISKIDKLINKATKAIELLKERKTALISAVVTGKIDVREEIL